jgi:hypothetical protein
LVALRICLDRILPPRKDRPVAFEIPPVTTIEDAPKIMAAVTAAVAQGGLERFPANVNRDSQGA